MSPTSLVAESALQLLVQRSDIQNTEQLNGLAHISMKRVLADKGRKSRSLKRTAKFEPLNNGSEITATNESDQSNTMLSAIEALRRIHPRQAEVVIMVCLREMTIEKAAKELKMTVPTLNRDLRAAREWLIKRLV